MRKVNFSKKDDYHTQINNIVIPLASCTPTSTIMAGKTEGCLFDYPKFMQPEDYFTILLRSDYGIDLRNSLTPWFKKDDVPPNEIHLVVSQMFNDLVGRKVTTFDENGNLDKLIKELRERHPVVVSGGFTGRGHTLCVVGYIEDDSGVVTDVIVDDPYGNYHKKYRDHRGNDISFPVNDFDRLWHGFMHIYRKDGFS